MKLNNRSLFPYPCLKSAPLEYKESVINFLINDSMYNLATNELQVYFSHNIESKFINRLIKEKLIDAYIEVYAKETNYLKYEKIIFLGRNKYINLDGIKVAGKTKLKMVLVANQKIENFSSAEFEFNDTYTVNKNNIVGFSNTVTIDVSSQNYYEKELISIFTITYNKDIITENYKVTLDGDKISIIVNKKETFDKLNQVISNMKYIPMVYQTLIIPALVQAILNINDESFKTNYWNKVLSIKLANTNLLGISYEKALLIAQILLKNPFNKMLDNIAELESRYEEFE